MLVKSQKVYGLHDSIIDRYDVSVSIVILDMFDVTWVHVHFILNFDITCDWCR